MVKTSQPSSLALYFTTVLLFEYIKTTRIGMESVTIESMTKFSQFFFISKVHIEMLVTGNVTEEQALQLADVVEGHLCMDTKPSVIREWTLLREVKLQTHCNYVYQRQHEIYDSSAALVYYQCFPKCTHYNMLLQLFHQIIKEPCFDTFRTQQQLGYDVCCQTTSIAPGVQGLYILI